MLKILIDIKRFVIEYIKYRTSFNVVHQGDLILNSDYNICSAQLKLNP